ncbi:MAG: c-type cytochrome [Bacteroidales bacterium]|nr:MAG: c-type cytochrome [Bacteroidales bacterium]
MNESNYIRNMQRVVMISSIILLSLTMTAWLREGLFRDWKKYQRQYNRLTDNPDSSDIADFRRGRKVYQVELDHFNRIDRCISCHNGLEDQRMYHVPQPHSVHPGDHLTYHPVQQFGCTICHGGQGRALEKQEAFGRDPDTHWPFPLLSEPYIQASCGKCHLTIFRPKSLEDTKIFQNGHVIFTMEGCLGCHKARGVGGILGPDLTEQGEKTKHEYSFQNIAGDQTISNWLKEHFRDPEMVSPGSQMLKLDLPEEDLEALVTFVMGLAKPEIPFEYFSIETLNEFKGDRELLTGNRLFAFFCSACHGKEGEGKDYESFVTGVVGIMNQDFLRNASEEFLHFTLRKGRSRRQMGSWAEDLSGWKSEEMDSVVGFLKGRKIINSNLSELNLSSGNTGRGEELFSKNCEMCHGPGGTGGVAIPVNSRDLLSRASSRFLYETIFYGRKNTAMPSWSDLTSGEMSDLLAYMQTWNTGPGNDLKIRLPEGNVENGSLKYHYLCSRCHGEFGEGDTGPAILNRNFVNAASDSYLYATIAEGRSHTAMFGWSTDVYDEERLGNQGISDLIAYMRSTANQRINYIHAGANPGNASTGMPLFRQHCSGCHGNHGEGTTAPAINNQEFLNAASNGFIMATISIGRGGTKMPSWGRGEDKYPMLDGKERQDIAAYIRSWQRISIRY